MCCEEWSNLTASLRCGFVALQSKIFSFNFPSIFFNFNIPSKLNCRTAAKNIFFQYFFFNLIFFSFFNFPLILNCRTAVKNTSFQFSFNFLSFNFCRRAAKSLFFQFFYLNFPTLNLPSIIIRTAVKSLFLQFSSSASSSSVIIIITTEF